jgi:hypothetical protein
MARMLWAMITKDEEFRGGPLLARWKARSFTSEVREKLKLYEINRKDRGRDNQCHMESFELGLMF